MRLKRLLLISACCLSLLSAYTYPAWAAGGLPNSASFGYGARLDMWGQDVFAAIELASNLNLDWIAVDVDWARHWPSLDQPADFSSLDFVLQAARQKNLSVLLALTHAPSWALTPSGPEPNYTNALLQSILNVYPDVIQAVELFPGANLTTRWGTVPDPQAYLSMLQTVRQGCDAAGRMIYLITTVEPTLTTISDGSLDDLAFLERLYTLGAMSYMPIIGIQFPTVMGNPMTEQSELYPLVLRHYEGVRATMLRYQHNNGMIWITGFTWPTSGTSDPAQPLNLPVTPAHQAQWVNQAFQLLRAQLFIGAAFFSSLNQNLVAQPAPSLLMPGAVIHPASVTISQFAGGSVNSTTWTIPQALPSTLPPSATIPIQSMVVKFLTTQGKPSK